MHFIFIYSLTEYCVCHRMSQNNLLYVTVAEKIFKNCGFHTVMLLISNYVFSVDMYGYLLTVYLS